MSIFDIFEPFDWISPLVQLVSGDNAISVESAADIEKLKRAGVKVGPTPFHHSDGWCITVDDVDRAVSVLHNQIQQETSSPFSLFINSNQPADWVCGYCENRYSIDLWKCPNCGAPRR